MTAQRRDWRQLIAELEKAGISAYKVSLIIGVQCNVVQRWQKGSEPFHWQGERLLALHLETCGK